jgi:hypothetical protein
MFYPRVFGIHTICANRVGFKISLTQEVWTRW